MSTSSRRPNTVSALRHPRRRGNPRLRRAAIGTLAAIVIAAGATFALAADPHVRAWAAIVAAVSLLGAVIAWLADKSRTLSSSGRDPGDFSIPPEAL